MRGLEAEATGRVMQRGGEIQRQKTSLNLSTAATQEQASCCLQRQLFSLEGRYRKETE